MGKAFYVWWDYRFQLTSKLGIPDFPALKANLALASKAACGKADLTAIL